VLAKAWTQGNFAMAPDPKQLDLGEEQDRMRTTVVQTSSATRHHDLARTRYWEERTGDTEALKCTAVTGETTLGIGPDDPILQAVEAAKLQLMEAERARADKLASTTDASAAIAELMHAERARSDRLASTVEVSVTQPQLGRTVDTSAAGQQALRSERSRATQRARVTSPAGTVLSSPVEAELPPKRFPRLRVLLWAASGLFVLGMALSLLMQPRPAPRPTRAVDVDTAPRAPEPTPQPSAAEPVRQPSERAAVDALIAGDYSLAGRQYTALAQGHPEQRVFSEAARILTKQH
jgi:hypothetical protein